jgi:hypothetical protein
MTVTHAMILEGRVFGPRGLLEDRVPGDCARCGDLIAGDKLGYLDGLPVCILCLDHVEATYAMQTGASPRLYADHDTHVRLYGHSPFGKVVATHLKERIRTVFVEATDGSMWKGWYSPTEGGPCRLQDVELVTRSPREASRIVNRSMRVQRQQVAMA